MTKLQLFIPGNLKLLSYLKIIILCVCSTFSKVAKMAALSSIWASVDWYHLALEVELLVRPGLVLGNVFVVDVPTGLKSVSQL